MLRKGLNNLKGNFLKTRPARQYAPSACFFSKSGTKPHRNLEGPQNGPHTRKRLISLGTRPALSHRVPVNPTFPCPPLFLLDSVSGHQGTRTRVHKLTRPRRVTARPGRLASLSLRRLLLLPCPACDLGALRCAWHAADKHAYQHKPRCPAPWCSAIIFAVRGAGLRRNLYRDLHRRPHATIPLQETPCN